MKFFQKWSARAKALNSEYGKAFSAEVPGNIQWDYAVATGNENYQFSDNVKFFESIEDYEWRYFTKLRFDKESDEAVFFVAEGIDYTFKILLDGNTLYSGEGMYSKTELDITNAAKNGSLLEVVVYPSPKRVGAQKGTREEADDCCKPPVCYGWDWNPRLLISGIWQPAYIETRRQGYIKNCEPFYELNENYTLATICFETECESSVTYTLTAPDGNTIYSGPDPSFSVKDPELWWCQGHGKPALYKWTAKSCDDEKSGYIGFKTIELVHNEGCTSLPLMPKGRYFAPITIKLNGKRIFAKGSNYVNPEVFSGRTTDDILKKQVKLAKDANMNILRCWGGAGPQKQKFYEECDKSGIMVWQEFMLACNCYKNTKHYLSVLEKEATAIIKLLRSHASLVIWCGGNELFNNWSNMSEQSHALRLLNKLCYELDRNTPFLATSPEYGMAHGGYTFLDITNGEDVMQKFIKSRNTAYTEFGVPSVAKKEKLLSIIPENELFPASDSPAWCAHHGFNAWVKDSWVCMEILEHYFGKSENLDEIIENSNLLQCEGYKAIFEEARKQWGHCSAAINWCFNEPWITAAGNSIVSYPCDPKPAYYAVKDALRAQMPSARIPKFCWQSGESFTAEIWYLNDGPDSVEDIVEIVLKFGNEEHKLLSWQTGAVKPNENLLGPAVNFKLPEPPNTERFILKLVSANENDSEYTLLLKAPTDTASVATMNF